MKIVLFLWMPINQFKLGEERGEIAGFLSSLWSDQVFFTTIGT
jgi:hypothetical protein